jgi:hypothetical protein|tara:strand:+ start:1288 stop:1551 length:264 start_codon:yes stop_codon:yes gene_type:complete
MPILLKKIDGSIISYFTDNGGADYKGDIILIKSVIGEVGLEDYFLLSAIEGFTQNFSAVIDAEFCSVTPSLIGPTNCSSTIELNLSY